MAGSITISQEYFYRKRSIICICTSDASGDVSGTKFKSQGGDLYAFGFVPGASVTDNWDITLKATYTKPDGTTIEWVDILNGQGSNLSNSTNGSWVNLSAPFPILPGMTLEPIIAGAGDAKTINTVFHVWEEIH